MKFNGILLKGLPFLLLLGGIRWLTLPEPNSQPEAIAQSKGSITTETNQSSALSPEKSKGNQQEFFSYENTCPVHLPHGMPTGTAATNDFIVRDIYCLSSNDTTKFADFVAYRLDRSNLDCPNADVQERNWVADPAIATNATLEPDDYTGAYKTEGYDRGHLAPLASFKCKNWEQVNYLSNITPQKSKLNRGAWKELENYERDLVWKHGEVYVITGTLQQNDQPAAQLPQADETHDVPEGYWKIVMYDCKLEAYIMPQWYSGKDWQQAIAPLSEVEQYTGLYLQNLLNHYNGPGKLDKKLSSEERKKSSE